VVEERVDCWPVVVVEPGVEVLATVSGVGGDEPDLWALVDPPDVEVSGGALSGPACGVGWKEQDIDESADCEVQIDANADGARARDPYDRAGQPLSEVEICP
jgi:hypothetical protein